MIARPAPTLVLATLLALGGTSAFAQATAATPAPAAPVATTAAAMAPADAPAAPADAPPAADAAPPAKTNDAKIEHLVTEDSQVRIEEVRVRGVTKKITVHSKIPGMGSYEIQPRDPGVDPENDHGAGMRLFNFGF